jgi:hypothetical protein
MEIYIRMMADVKKVSCRELFKNANHLNWTNHIDKLIPKLSGACYAVGSMLHVRNRHSQIGLLCLFSLFNEVWNNVLG